MNRTLSLPFPVRDQEELEAELSSLVAAPVSLTLTRNRTSMASFQWDRKKVKVRLNNQFLDASPDIVDQVAFWIRHPRKGVPTPVRDFIRSIPDLPGSSRPALPIRPEGKVHNLHRLMQQVNDRDFDGSLNLQITWGRDTSPKNVRRRRLGSFQHDTRLIVIHPVLDDERVPEHVVTSIIHHEMLHALQPSGMRRPHDSAFRKAERAHPDYERTERWLIKHSSFIHRGRRKRIL